MDQSGASEKIASAKAFGETSQTKPSGENIAAQSEAESNRFFDLLQSIDAIVWEMDLATGQFLFVSDRAEPLLGYPPEQWLSSPTFWQDRLLHPDDRDRIIQSRFSAAKAGRDHELEYRAIAADGQTVWLKDTAHVVKDSQNRLQMLCGMMLNITKQKIKEQEAKERDRELQREREARQELEVTKEALRKSEERYRSLIQATAQIVWDTKPEGELVSEQSEWSAFTGQTVEQYQGWGWLEAIHPDDRAHTAQAWNHSLATQALYEVEHRLRRHDGVYRDMSVRGVPILEPDGTVREWVGIHTDITDRKQERELRDRLLAEAQEARTEFQTVFALAPASIWTTRGPNHVIHTANAVFQQFNGLGADCLGRSAREVLPLLAQQGFFDLLDQVYASGQPYVGREERADFDLDGDGQIEESYWNYIYHPLFDANGQVYGTMVHAVDVTEQVRSRQEVEQKAEKLLQLTRALEASNRELDQFAYIASHDLKAPLRAIANLSTWLEEDLEDCLTDDARQQMKLLRGRVHRMEALIEGILQYSRAGRFRGKLERVNVQRLLQETIELLSPPPEVQIVIQPGMPTLTTEKIPLEQVFLNLIGNALKYGQSAQPKIEIRVEEQEQFYQFAVADHGAGIAPEYQHKIWGIFQRLEARDQVEGTGIGLAVVQKTVEMRGGNVWVKSSVGQGATFYFTWAK